MPITPARMPIMDHLGELRRRLTIVVVSVLACSIVVYFATPTLIDILMVPINAHMPEGAELTILTVLGGFTIRFKVAFFFGMIMATPIIIWEAMAFFLPALRPSERKWVVPTLGAMVALFFIGMIFCYFVIQGPAFGWMLDQTAAFANVMPNAEDFLDIEMLLEIGFGIAFQIPLVVFYLCVFHILPYSTLRSQWRYVYVAMLVLSACVTPDASPVTMILMFAALVGLYELALLVARYAVVARDGKAALKWTRADYEEHEFENL